MSDTSSFGFGKFVPGFDFLQNIAKGAAGGLPQLPNLSNWVAPTLNVEELDKRIDELKAVHFWLDQNGKALAATIQALEVQKMTLATLKGMNFSMGDVADAFKIKAADSVIGGVQKAGEMAAGVAGTAAGVAKAAASRRKPAGKAASKASSKAAPAGVVDPLQWWGSLTQQFQEIAAGAMKDAARQTAAGTAKNLAAGAVKEAAKTVRRAAAPRKAPAQRTRSRAGGKSA